MKKRNNYQTSSKTNNVFSCIIASQQLYFSLGWSEDESLIIVVISNWQPVVGLISQFSHFTLPTTTNSYVLKYKDTRSTHFSSSSPKSKVRAKGLDVAKADQIADRPDGQ